MRCLFKRRTENCPLSLHLEKEQPSVFRRKKFRLPYPSCQLCVPNSSNSEFRRKKLKIFFQRNLLSVGIRSLLVSMYLKWKKRTFFGTSREIFSLRLIATGESGILLPSYLSLDYCYPESRKNLQVCSPSDSYVFERGKNPNFELLF